jgi:hypothetical protein
MNRKEICQANSSRLSDRWERNKNFTAAFLYLNRKKILVRRNSALVNYPRLSMEDSHFRVDHGLLREYFVKHGEDTKVLIVEIAHIPI